MREEFKRRYDFASYNEKGELMFYEIKKGNPPVIKRVGRDDIRWKIYDLVCCGIIGAWVVILIMFFYLVWELAVKHV